LKTGDRPTKEPEDARPGGRRAHLPRPERGHEQPAINLQIARAYLMASDPLIVNRTWQQAMRRSLNQTGFHARPLADGHQGQGFDPIRKTPLIETQAEHLLNVLSRGTVSTNVHLRKLHNFCLDMNWLPWPVVPKRQWPEVRFKEKRAITFEEHQAILAREQNPERKAYTSSAGSSAAVRRYSAIAG